MNPSFQPFSDNKAFYDFMILSQNKCFNYAKTAQLLKALPLDPHQGSALDPLRGRGRAHSTPQSPGCIGTPSVLKKVLSLISILKSCQVCTVEQILASEERDTPEKAGL